ncbi:hypothetical protein F5Y00DRAFT_273961 [Daldinia vernicosa]|uniref:uncharacterized protein n=1 Tax=Daldinia vernicosa TaxID=114800 RepID=UPI0020087B98|nr:uncharacterized protein F5Y00DRAFT_273961 [Daldinia vernicosa]KAI0844535.1 hypothetical protein F5Y00DRAFT_273961 [Daldinia vernicosa]
MLERIRCFKERRSDKSPVTMRKARKKELKNVCVFKRLLGNKGEEGLGRSSTSSEQPPNFGSSILGQATIPNSNGTGWKTSIPSLECDRSDVAQPWHSPVGIPSPYQDSGFPEMMVLETVSSKLVDDFSGRYYMSPNTQSPTLPKQPPPWIQNHTELVTGPNTDLSVLFQQPVRLRPHTESYPSRLQNHSSSSDPSSPPLQTFLSLTPSTSCSSMVSESITKPTNSLSDDGDRSPRLAHSLSYRIALSQVFMYQARMSDRPPKSTLAIPGDDM